MKLERYMNLPGSGLVEIETAGHFPTTVMVKTKNGLKMEVNITDLQYP